MAKVEFKSNDVEDIGFQLGTLISYRPEHNTIYIVIQTHGKYNILNIETGAWYFACHEQSIEGLAKAVCYEGCFRVLQKGEQVVLTQE